MFVKHARKFGKKIIKHMSFFRRTKFIYIIFIAL